MRHDWLSRLTVAVIERMRSFVGGSLSGPTVQKGQDCFAAEPWPAPGASAGDGGWWQAALRADRTIAFEWDARLRSSQRSANAHDILGFSPADTITPALFLAQVHGEDRGPLLRALTQVSPDNTTYSVSFRFIRLDDGRQLWLRETGRAEFDQSARVLRVSGLTHDISQRKRSEEHQARLVGELDHRLKNVLARVAVVAQATREGSRSLDEFVRAFDRRLKSLTDAYTLLDGSKLQGVDLHDLIRHQLAPYAVASNTSLDGPKMALAATATEAFAMVLHELVTNAAKYGALSAPHGKVLVSWEIQRSAGAQPILKVSWQETGGPPVAHPLRSGYGISLIRELIPHEVGGKVDFKFAAEGMHCTLEIPVEQVARTPTPGAPDHAPAQPG